MGAGGGQDLFGPVTVQVHHGTFGLVKDHQFGLEIVLRGGVFLGADVILPDVEESGHRQLHPGHTAVFQRLAGALHHHIAAAGVGGVPQVALEV